MNRPDVIAYLRGLSLEEVQGVLSDIEGTWSSRIILHGTCDGCYQIVLGPHACPGPRPEERGQSEFEVVLTGVPHSTTRLPIIQALRASNTLLTIAEARDLLERLPAQIQTGLSRVDAKDLAQRLRDAGGLVEVR